MKIAVIGPGALGCLLAASLARKYTGTADQSFPPHEIWLVDYNRERAGLLQSQGLYIIEESRQYQVSVKATSTAADVGPADIIFLCVKSGDVGPALTEVQALAGPSSLLVTMQNGIGHLPLLENCSEPPAVAIGVTAQGANLTAPGKVRHAGSGITRIGMLAKTSEPAGQLLLQVAALLNDAGLETVVVENIIEYVWAKLMINVGINALTAIYNCPNGELLESADIRGMLAAAVQEAREVAMSLGIGLTGDPVAITEEVCKKTADNISSMLQDVRRRRPTEIDSINGAVVRAAEQLDIAVPVNRELVAAVKKIEQGY